MFYLYKELRKSAAPMLLTAIIFGMIGCGVVFNNPTRLSSLVIPSPSPSPSSTCNAQQSPFGGGSGTAADPYQICSFNHLNQVQNYLSKSFKQMTNIDLSGQSFSPIGSTSTPFTGTYDGENYTISNWSYGNSTSNNVGLFSVLSGSASISNLGLLNFNLTGSTNTGLLVGVSDANSQSVQISNCYSKGQVTGTLNNTGGLVGRFVNGAISNSYSNAQVTGWAGTGGLVGVLKSSQIVNSYATGSVTGTRVGPNYLGGLVGSAGNGSTISESYATGNISGSDSYVGGLIGVIQTAPTTTVSNCYATGNVSSPTGQDLGGLIGFIDNAIVQSSRASGTVTGVSYMGGLIGEMGSTSPSVSKSFSTGTVSGSSGVIGGLIGNIGSGTVSTSYSTSNVSSTGSNYIAGFAGTLGNVSNISNSYATGNANASTSGSVGGFVGRATGASATISNSYSTGVPTGTSSVGGFLGNCSSCGAISNSYWDTNTSGTGSSAGGTPYTTVQMQTQSNFSSWDFSSIWQMSGTNVYPTLK